MAKSTSTSPSATTAQRRSVESGKLEKYGYLVDRNTPLLKIELQAYADKLTPADGGLGLEQHFKNAYRLMWPKYEWSDWVEMLIWAWCNYKYVSVIGHTRASKSYTMAHIAYLDYCASPIPIADPKTGKMVGGTMTSFATVTFQGLKIRMWADLLMAAGTAVVPCPFKIASTTNEMQLYVDDRDNKEMAKFQIHGLAINNNENAEGRIRGAHANRRRLIVDEAQDVAPVIYDAMTNPAAAPDARIVLLTNPKNKVSPFGNHVEPVNGWSSVNENDLFWETKKGGICLHFDGLQSPNVKAGKTIFTGLLTNEVIEETRKVDGENSVAWWSRIRGFFAPDGMVSLIWPSSVILKARPSIVFDFRPEGCASLDPAYEQDKAVLHLGDIGKLPGGREAINCKETLVMAYKVGPDQEGKHYQLAHWVMEVCKARGIPPANFIMDKTGGGSGTYDILCHEWSPDVQGIEYGGAATERPIRMESSAPANTRYKYFVTELWFRAMHCVQDGLLAGLANLHKDTERDLNSREYEVKQFSEGEKIQAETKRDMKKRLGCSPDFGDSFVQFGELLCRRGQKPGAANTLASIPSQKWGHARERARKACKVYATETFSH